MKLNDTELSSELINIVGEEWVSSDPEIVYAYSRDGSIFPEDLDSVLRPPFYAVLPGTTEELQKIMAIAKKFDAPITIQATGLNICGSSVPLRGGILVDVKRMDKVIEIDEQNCTATVQPYVSIGRLSAELKKRGMYMPIPGCPSTVSVISNWVFGLGLKVANRVGQQYESLVGLQMLLPSGDQIRLGSRSDPIIQKDIWPYGPGPNMHFLPMWSMGSTGIVTEMTIKCWHMGENYKELWVSYENVDKCYEAFAEMSRMDIGKGINVYAGSKYAYFTDTRESVERMVRANPEFQIIVSMDGTERRIKYEEGLIREVAEKTGGSIITDKFEPYESFVDSHTGMSGGFSSEYSMKYWGARGVDWTVFSTTPPESMADQYKAFTEAVLADPEYGDPDFGHGEFWRSCIGYSYSGGHYWLQENGFDCHPGDPKWQELTLRMSKTFPAHAGKKRVLLGPPVKYPRTGAPSFGSALYQVTKKIAMRLDPEGYMNGGILFRY
ncbi:FAD-binding oxidoreductase [Spirochaetota bacterium]